MQDNIKNILSVNINVRELEAFLEYHIEKAISKAIETREKQYQTAKQQEVWLTRKEVTEILGISMPTLNAWSKDGTIPGYRIGGLVRYKRSKIDGALKQMRTSNSRRRLRPDCGIGRRKINSRTKQFAFDDTRIQTVLLFALLPIF